MCFSTRRRPTYTWFFHIDLLLRIEFGAWHKQRYNDVAITGAGAPDG